MFRIFIRCTWAFILFAFIVAAATIIAMAPQGRVDAALMFVAYRAGKLVPCILIGSLVCALYKTVAKRPLSRYHWFNISVISGSLLFFALPASEPTGASRGTPLSSGEHVSLKAVAGANVSASFAACRNATITKHYSEASTVEVEPVFLANSPSPCYRIIGTEGCVSATDVGASRRFFIYAKGAAKGRLVDDYFYCFVTPDGSVKELIETKFDASR